MDHEAINFLKYTAGTWESIASSVITEAPVSLTVNGEIWLTLMCTPNYLEALAAGFLYNEGIIGNRDEIVDLRVCESGDNVDVWLTKTADKPKDWKRTSGCTGGLTAVDYFDLSPRIQDDTSIEPSQVGYYIGNMIDSQELYRLAGGVHTSVLSDGEGENIIAEDVGRHNSLDKIAGRYLLEGYNLKRKILLTTGRISSEMIYKSARIGASVVISRTSPSSLSIELADMWGITLIGYARRDRFNVYTHPQRVNYDSSPLNLVIGHRFNAQDNGD